MYVCICNAVTDTQIRRAAAAGTTNFQDLQNTLSVGSRCGKCVEHAQEMLEEMTGSPSRVLVNTESGGCDQQPWLAAY